MLHGSCVKFLEEDRYFEDRILLSILRECPAIKYYGHEIDNILTIV